ncbi:outer membrane protein [Paremcibacter congregatus]|uniref:outer membrane protein n=1 Tax=Paremcibacter congregatus TaxID=2043170 RepID=UPI003A911BF5
MPHKLKIALLGATMLGFASTSAQAGLDGNPFEGLYLGFNANYSKVKSKNSYEDLEPGVDELDNNFFTGIGNGAKNTGYGGSLYGGIGTNFWGPMYVSIEGALGLAGGSSTATVNTVTPASGTTEAVHSTANLKLKAGFAFDINARLGFTVSDQVLVYGLGGYTSTKFKASVSGQDFSSSAGGYRYGAGFEVGIMEDIALRIEYVRTAHSDINWRTNADSLTFDPSTEALRIGLILHMD